MRRKREWGITLGLALAVAASISMVSLAKEERQKVGTIELSFSYDIQAGESGGDVDVTLGSGNCSIESVDIVNEKEFWVGGDKPKVEVWLSADSDYYLQSRERAHFPLAGIR